jgi:hypothetical protein
MFLIMWVWNLKISYLILTLPRDFCALLSVLDDFLTGDLGLFYSITMT